MWSLVIDGFKIERAELTEDEGAWLIQARSTKISPRCPKCGCVSIRVHSYYQRQLRDLSVDGHPVRLLLTVRRLRCQNDDCPRKTFAECIEPLAGARQQLTKRFVEALRVIGLALNGEGGARLAHRLHLPTSGDTILKIIRLTPEPSHSTPRVLGVDDWAQKKCRIYGTILVDVEQHCVVDLLEGRTAEVVATWLKAHPGVEIVTRDRSTEYAGGIATGAPDCRQVADRWHLLHNVSEALERFLQRSRTMLESLYTEATASAAAQSLSLYDRSRRRWRGDDSAAQAYRNRRKRFHATVQRLKRQGLNILQIARRLGHSWTRVRDFYHATACPERRTPTRQKSAIDPYAKYLSKRWSEGCRNAQQLWREIRQQGFKGSHRMVTLWAQARRDPSAPITGRARQARISNTFGAQAQVGRQKDSTCASASLAPAPLPSNRELVWALLTGISGSDCNGKTSAHQQLLKTLNRNGQFKTAVTLAQRFAALVRNGKPRRLNPWMREAVESGVEEIASFATGLQRDIAGVRAAIATHWSNAQSEGQINRLKLTKRLMYGRAQHDLLRIRCLNPA